MVTGAPTPGTGVIPVTTGGSGGGFNAAQVEPSDNQSAAVLRGIQRAEQLANDYLPPCPTAVELAIPLNGGGALFLDRAKKDCQSTLERIIGSAAYYYPVSTTIFGRCFVYDLGKFQQVWLEAKATPPTYARCM